MMNLAEPEFYRLVCCTTQNPLSINGQEILFKFTGKAYNENYPDKFFNKTVGEIRSISKMVTEGCFKLIPIADCDVLMYKVVDWETFFVDVEVHDDCQSCLPDREIVEGIRLIQYVPERAPIPCFDTIKAYNELVFAEAMQVMEGIKMCCLPDKMSTIRDFKVWDWDRNIEHGVCCPPCVIFDLFFPQGLIGTYSYYNCSGELITADIDAVEDTTVSVCGCASQNLSSIVFEGTGDGFTVTPTGVPCVE